MERLGEQIRRDVPPAFDGMLDAGLAISSRPSPASSCAATSASWRRSSIGRRRGCRLRRSFQLEQLRPPKAAACPRRRAHGSWKTGSAGFTPDGREYVIVLDGDRETPLPWSNAGEPGVRHVLSASGAAYTWAATAGRNRLTLPFANDRSPTRPAKRSSSATTTTAASGARRPGPFARAADSGRWVVRHAAGVTRFQTSIDGLEQELTIAVAPDDPVKVSRLTLTNTSSGPAA